MTQSLQNPLARDQCESSLSNVTLNIFRSNKVDPLILHIYSRYDKYCTRKFSCILVQLYRPRLLL